MALCELGFPREGDLYEFLFTYGLAEMRGGMALPAYITGEAYTFYREEFSKTNTIMDEGTSYTWGTLGDVDYRT